MALNDTEYWFVYGIAEKHAKAEVRRIMQGEDESYLEVIDPGQLASDVFDVTLPDVDATRYTHLEAKDVSDVAYEAAHTVLSNAIITRNHWRNA